ncbi:MAG TPA: GntR family transcriptional regulator [Bryobacteraceae bacterium]|nr:GntR family transcriptional regulator [Bryobacteraceae bacterium]
MIDQAHPAAARFDPSDIEAVERAPSLPETVARKLREAILSDRLRPGQRLVEQKLAAHFRVGQPTLREALHELEAQGFVRKSQKRGTHVTELSAEEYRQTHDVRMTLEALAMERAAPNITEEALGDLDHSLKQLAIAAQQPDLNLYHKSDMEFHKAIWKLTGNECLCVALERITFGLFAFALLGGPSCGARPDLLAAVEQHRDIVEGLRTRNPRIARETFVRATLKFWKEQHCVEISPSETLTHNVVCGSS